MNNFSQKLNLVVSQIPKGKFLTYRQVAKQAGSFGAVRSAGSILAKNRNPNIPCHRVIKSDFSIGGFRGEKEDSWEKAALLLNEGLIGVIPTDTIYGVVGLAFNESTVERLYKIRRRSPDKPMIILISSQDELDKFKIKTNNKQHSFLTKIWPGKVSVVLNYPFKDLFYLHRGSQTLSFRVPSNKKLLKLLEITGPLVAPSANLEGFPPATTISKARKYFGESAFYLNDGKIDSEPSTLVRLLDDRVELLRMGAEKIKDFSL